MALVLQEGDTEDMVHTPPNFPTCGSFQITKEQIEKVINDHEKILKAREAGKVFGPQLPSSENPLWVAIKDREGNQGFEDINLWPWGIHLLLFLFERYRRKPMVREATPTMGFRRCLKERPDLDDFVSETIDKKSSTGLITAIYDDKSKTSENSLTSDAHDHPNATKSPRPEKNDPFSLDDR